MTTVLKPAIPTIARALSISRTTARRMVDDGSIPIVRVGRLKRIDEDQLLEWIRKGGTAARPRRSDRRNGEVARERVG